MLLSYEEDDVEDVFGLNFCISFNILGETHTTELLSGGTEKPVTNANRDEYVRVGIQFFEKIIIYLKHYH